MLPFVIYNSATRPPPTPNAALFTVLLYKWFRRHASGEGRVEEKRSIPSRFAHFSRFFHEKRGFEWAANPMFYTWKPQKKRKQTDALGPSCSLTFSGSLPSEFHVIFLLLFVSYTPQSVPFVCFLARLLSVISSLTSLAYLIVCFRLCLYRFIMFHPVFLPYQTGRGLFSSELIERIEFVWF